MGYSEADFRVDEVDTNGIEVLLVRHARSTSTESWTTFSWRTRLAPGGSNRRFYMHQGEPWTISSQLAIAMLSEMDRQHPFASDLGTTVRPEVLFSCSMTPEMRFLYWREICLPEDRWSSDVEFVVTQDPFQRNHWRKIGIVDHSRNRATFRSTTRDATYAPKKTIPDWNDWFLDNSMLDADGREMGAFLDLLSHGRPS